MMDDHEGERLGVLFAAVRLFVFSSGGDGDGWVISPRYGELAEAFEAREKALVSPEGPWFTDRYEQPGVVTFGNGQECVCFVDGRDKLPGWAGDIIVEFAW